MPVGFEADATPLASRSPRRAPPPRLGARRLRRFPRTNRGCRGHDAANGLVEQRGCGAATRRRVRTPKSRPSASSCRTMPPTTSWASGTACPCPPGNRRRRSPAADPKRHALFLSSESPALDDADERGERAGEGVFGVEHRFLVFLQILVISARQSLHRRQPAGEMADGRARPCRESARADLDSSSAASCCCRCSTRPRAGRIRALRRRK